MIVFKYTKINGAEYVSHLDMLRHLSKIMRRAGLPMGYSKGFNPHMSIFMSAPIAVGVSSKAEFCFVETTATAEEFLKAFNQSSFKGVECTFAISVNKKVSVAGVINRALYRIKGVNKFDLNEVLNATEFEFTNKKGERKEVRNKIFSLSWDEDVLVAQLGFGNEGLRPDLFAQELVRLYGGNSFIEVSKEETFVNEEKFEDYLMQFKA